MFTEKQLDRYAEVLLWALKKARSRPFRREDIVLIRYHRPALRLAEILYAKILQMGMNPLQRIIPTPVMEKDFFELSNHRQLVFQAPGDKELFQNLNGSLFLHAPESITHLSDIDPRRIGKATVAAKYLRDILNRRDQAGSFGWTLCTFPTAGLAEHAGITPAQYAAQIVSACFLNRTSPLKHWEEVFKSALAIKKWLNQIQAKTYHIESDNIDLTVTPGKKRKWIGLSGHNIPSFELFLSPDWRGSNGIYYSDLSSYRSGNYVRGVRLEFKQGVVVDAKAREGEHFLKAQLALDGGADKIGEFSLTDKRFSRISKFMANTLFDENYGGKYGNCHLALGSSYANSYAGSPNQLTPAAKKNLGFNDSALHWDLVNTEKKRVTARLASGEKIVLYENGLFLNPNPGRAE